ncbi:MAG: phytoene dehydrogenase-like oxidoreductase, partial [Gammaproteobacteria bacterium]|nr:phytoene dehydrogenase-like oxidoreductase [Gammaproteobacteria bacterium]
MTKTVIIIGGGHNGLVCAAYLAKAGLEVTVVERRPVLGGAAVTEEFHPGFRNSIASYTVSLLHPKIIADLNLARHGLRIIPRRINNYLPLPDGDAFIAWPEPESLQREIARFAESDIDNLRHYNQLLAAVVPIIKDLLLQTPPAIHA